ncbi:MAG: DNA-directed RNA polymerase subunit omega [bacterium]
MKNEDLVEEYPREYETTQFEKVLVSAQRAKDIHRGHKQPLVESERKAPYVALEEYNEDIIHLVYHEEEPPEAIAAGSEESEEEE